MFRSFSSPSRVPLLRPGSKLGLASLCGLVALPLFLGASGVGLLRVEQAQVELAHRLDATQTRQADLYARLPTAASDRAYAPIRAAIVRNEAQIAADRASFDSQVVKVSWLVWIRLTGMGVLLACVVILIRLALLDRDAHAIRLRAASEAAEAANQAKGRFLANMSHEIRTPLNGVLAMAQILAREELTHGQREKLEVIRGSSEDLLHIVNDILDFSKIEAGKLELETLAFDPELVLERVLASFEAVARRKQIQLRLDFAPQALGLRLGDPSRLRQIVGNFVSNAVKFTEAGSVLIQVADGADNGRQGLRIAVRDSGVGVAPEKMPLLFQKFSQVDASTTRQFGGTGLGLAICRELAALMGGRVWAESTPGEGSTFFVVLQLPRAEASAHNAAALPPPSHAGAAPRQAVRVLAAEDNSTNQLVLSTIMEMFGFELTLVGDGRQAVQAWREGDFDLILMDVQMPVMDGVAATRLIREQEAAAKRRRIPIVALSANAFSHQSAEYSAAGMDAHVSKPIELATLQAVIEQVLACGAPDENVCA